MQGKEWSYGGQGVCFNSPGNDPVTLLSMEFRRVGCMQLKLKAGSPAQLSLSRAISSIPLGCVTTDAFESAVEDSLVRVSGVE